MRRRDDLGAVGGDRSLSRHDGGSGGQFQTSGEHGQRNGVRQLAKESQAIAARLPLSQRSQPPWGLFPAQCGHPRTVTAITTGPR